MNGKLISLPVDMQTFGVPGARYILEIGTDGVPSLREVRDRLGSELKKFDIDVEAVNVSNTTVRVQFVAGLPFSWAALVAALPLILKAIGIAVTAVSAYLVMAAVPRWVWILLVTGIFLATFAESLAKFVVGKRIE